MMDDTNTPPGTVIVRIEHIRAAKICVAGARGWFPAYGLDFRAFLRDGLPASVLLATGDPLAERAVEQAMKEARHG